QEPDHISRERRFIKPHADARLRADTRGRRSDQHPALLEREDCRPMAWYPCLTHLAGEGRMTVTIGRRELLAALGGPAAALPIAARAQQRERVRRMGVLLPATADDAVYQAWAGAFVQGLAQMDWLIGRNVLVDTRWATANAEAIRRQAAELVAL